MRDALTDKSRFRSNVGDGNVKGTGHDDELIRSLFAFYRSFSYFHSLEIHSDCGVLGERILHTGRHTGQRV